MTATHRELNGNWSECPAPDSCPLRFHFPNMTPEQVAVIPFRLLLPMLNVMDPPDRPNDLGGDTWLSKPAPGVYDRDYDLPARIEHNGQLTWYRHGTKHRGFNRPQLIMPNGHREWWVTNLRHRTDGPAVVHADGTVEYWYKGVRLSSAWSLARSVAEEAAGA